MNSFIYRIHYEVEAMKRGGFSVNESMNDHTVRLDAVKARAMIDEIEGFRGEMEGNRAELLCTKDDIHKVMNTLTANDTNIKTILNGFTQEMGGKLTSVEGYNNKMLIDSNRRFDELERRALASWSSVLWVVLHFLLRALGASM